MDFPQIVDIFSSFAPWSHTDLNFIYRSSLKFSFDFFEIKFRFDYDIIKQACEISNILIAAQ